MAGASTTMALDVSTVPAPGDVEAIVDHVAALPTSGARYAALFAAVGMAGMRPSEAIGLRSGTSTCRRRAGAWRPYEARSPRPAPATPATGRSGAQGPQAPSRRAVREVPLSPDLVRRLREHLARFEPVDAQVFTNAGGRPTTSTNYGPVWLRARADLWTQGHPLAKATVYDLRHAAATMMLRASVPPAEVARRLGHSVDVLMRVLRWRLR